MTVEFSISKGQQFMRYEWLRRSVRIRCVVTGALLVAGGSESWAQRGAGSTIPVPDAVLGISEGNMALLPGWHGTARANRTADPVAAGTAALDADLVSGDGSMSILILPVAFHTLSPSLQRFGNAVSGDRAEVAAYASFKGTADVLTRFVMPRLHLGGQASAPFAIDQDKLPGMRQQMAQMGVPNAIVDAAGVLVQDASKGLEVLVMGVTTGGGYQTPNEMTMTHLILFRAPLGRARQLEAEYSRLPDVQMNPAWVRADREMDENKKRQIEQEGERARAQIRAASDAQTAGAQRGMAVRQGMFDQHNRAWANREQAISDSNALTSGYLGDHSVSYRWCNASGDVRTAVNSTVSPGAGYRRCP